VKLSPTGRKLIQQFEGLSLRAYRDADGYSIGYGHFGARAGDVITQDVAEALFDADVARFEAAVSKTIPSCTQNQFDACVSLAYNVGTQAFATSTLARKHNAGDFSGASAEFPRWNKSQGVVLSVLVQRRDKERAVYVGYVGGGGQFGGSGATGSWEQPPATEPLPVSNPPTRPAPRGGLGALALLFFCP
jgi:lysozyme